MHENVVDGKVADIIMINCIYPKYLGTLKGRDISGRFPAFL